MKVLIDIKDNKAHFIMELLQNFSFVKTKALTPYKAEVLESIQEAVEEMKLIKEGKLSGRNAEDLFNEL
jgi:hypothetical protein